MREGLRSGKKGVLCSLNDRGVVEKLDFGVEDEECWEIGGLETRSGRRRQGRKRKNVEVMREGYGVEGNRNGDGTGHVGCKEVGEEEGTLINVDDGDGVDGSRVKEAVEGDRVSCEKEDVSLMKVDDVNKVDCNGGSVDAHLKEAERVDQKEVDSLMNVDNGDKDSGSGIGGVVNTPLEGDQESDGKEVDCLMNVDNGDRVDVNGTGGFVNTPLMKDDEGDYKSDEKKEDCLMNVEDDFKVVAGVEMIVDVNADADASVNTPVKEADGVYLESNEKKEASDEGDKVVASGEVSVNANRKVYAGIGIPVEEADEGNCVSEAKKVQVQYCAVEDIKVINRSFHTCEGQQEPAKKRRGRKRKILEGSESVNGYGKKRDNDGVGPVSRRVLRSNSNACEENFDTNMDDKLMNCGTPKMFTGSRGRPPKVQEESQVVMDAKTTTEEDEKPRHLGRPKKLKGPVGRPPKVMPNNEPSGEEDSYAVKDEKVRSFGRPKKTKGRRGRPPKVKPNNQASGEEDSDLENDEKPRCVRKSKKFKGSVGRPPKVELNSEASGEDDFDKENDEKPQKFNSMVHGKMGGLRLSSEVNSDNKEEVAGSERSTSQSKIEKKKTEKMGLREEKQGIRDQIADMLKKAGWTIEYRARQKKDYADAVYVDGNGRTHWSATLAYHKLKEKVKNGTADSKEVSAFEPIPAEVLSKLFRMTVPGRKRMKGNKSVSKSVQIFDRKHSLKKKIATKATGHKKRSKEKKSFSCRAGERTSKKGMNENVSDSEQNDSRRGMSCSKWETRKGGKPCPLLARTSGKGSDAGSNGDILYHGKRSIWSWMIDLGTLSFSARVKYVDSKSKKILVEGNIARDGILCGCCNNVLAISEFLSHTGTSVSPDSHPYNDIYIGSKLSLSQCLLDSWNKQVESDPVTFCSADVDRDDPNDDTCIICADGGDLICCDGCPSTYHQSCLDYERFPSGKWWCLHCLCKFCKTIDGKIFQGDDSCRNPSGLLKCRLCQEKFHQHCTLGENAEKIDPTESFFCGIKCQEIFEQLQALIGVRHELEEGFSWTLLQYSDVNQDSSHIRDPLKLECNAKLAVAFSIMDECFCPIIDERTGINTIHNVVYSCGSNFDRLNYNGFFTIILEKGDDMISAACTRIHGGLLAEMPFVGTRLMYRRQGMLRRLLNAVESALCSLNVQKLVIPAISELHQVWTSIFGFKNREKSTRDEMQHMSVIVFRGTDMLEKPILQYTLATPNLISAAVAAATGIEVEHDAPIDLQHGVGKILTNMIECTNAVSGVTNALSDKTSAYVEMDSDVKSIDASSQGIQARKEDAGACESNCGSIIDILPIESQLCSKPSEQSSNFRSQIDPSVVNSEKCEHLSNSNSCAVNPHCTSSNSSAPGVPKVGSYRLLKSGDL